MRKTVPFTIIALLAFSHVAMAVPDTVSIRVTDVTTSSFALVWMTDIPAEPAVEIYSDAYMAMPVTENIIVTAMPDAPPEVIAAATTSGIMKIRVSGLNAGTRYYARSVTRDPANHDSVGYSSLQEITTATEVRPYVSSAQDGSLQGIINDMAVMKIYIRPSDQSTVPGLGNLLILETSSSAFPLSVFAGSGIAAPEGMIDLSNLYDTNRVSQSIIGGEITLVSIYRGGALSALRHYRRLPPNSGQGLSAEPVKGFFADINLDGTVDDTDFEAFRNQYRTRPDDPSYNPDFKFVPTSNGNVDAQDFTRFSREYGRTDVPDN